MKNLLEAYAESLKSSHISIESDKQPVSIDVDETFSICKNRPYTEGISKAVQEMNLSRKEKIVKCYADTGFLR